MTVPADRIWTQHLPGEIRDQILVSFRNGLRRLTDPDTGQAFAEDRIRQVTMPRSRFYVEANSIDVISQGIQRRDELLAQQVDPRRATSGFLRVFHGPAWGIAKLDATGGSGVATVTGAAPGTIWLGSTTNGDPFAVTAQDEAGNVYQVFVDALASALGTASLTFVAVSTGEETNLLEDAVLTFRNAPPGSPPTCIVAADFTGGTNAETDAEWGQRIFDGIGSRAAAGNPAHFREWARRASNAVADAFVYPCALNAGSVLVAVTQKRGGVAGPEARVPSVGTMSVVAGYLTPPTSGVVPARAHVVCTGWTPEPVDAVLQLGLRRGSISGWADSAPWPSYSSNVSEVTSVIAPQVTFRINSDTALPSSGVPQLMLWNDEESAFEQLAVASVTDVGGSVYEVTLAPAHTGKTITVGDYVSPYSARLVEISEAIVAYFDSLGLGELVDLTTDMRAARAFRRPRPEQAASYYAGANLATYIEDALGGNLFHRVLSSISQTTPTLPTTVSAGPNGLTAGKLAIYAVT
jgi:hypothetical protein